MNGVHPDYDYYQNGDSRHHHRKSRPSQPDYAGYTETDFMHNQAYSERHKIIRASGSMASAAGNPTPELDPRRDKRSKGVTDRVSRYGREMSDRRDEIFANTINDLTTQTRVLYTHPASSSAYSIRLYPLTIERAAMLDAIDLEDQYALENVRATWEEEKDKIEDEYRKGQERVRERILEGIEERRRKAREEKDGEGIVVGDSSLDAPSISNATRIRPATLSTNAPTFPFPFSLAAPTPYGLALDDISSPFSLSLTAAAPGGLGAGGPRKRQNRGAGRDGGVLTLGKAIQQGLTPCKEGEIDSDLGEIRKGMKRRRAAVKAAGG
ncbi:hypothetical protein BOTBODRAFT_49133 [Botryobasidium botryosum FD-172 SS1]|uniref:Uncharacterized protein n=1 Tax=Botryobasidium botryosum (strain FD-172 SS1) TaxID=930990 RepID=A0A067LU99_BOTB1|nr:hypothetical protein BOTBODRAFT_49133 [Botryobasidium botryosum FD-172 SS1]